MSNVTVNRRLEDELVRRERILGAVADAAARFLRAPSWEDEAAGLGVALGEAAQVSRTYIFRFDSSPGGKLLASQLYVWMAPGITPQIGNPVLQEFDMAAVGCGEWVEILTRGEVLQRHAERMSDAEREFCAPQDIRSIVMVPLMVSGHIWGFLGFDECVRQRDWTTAELDALRSAAGILGGTIARERGESRQREQQEAIRQLTEDLSGKIGEAFFEGLAGHLARTLKADCALICELDRDTEELHAVASYTDPMHGVSTNCPLQGGPCEDVINQGVLIVPARLAERYPAVDTRCGATAFWAR